MRRDDVDFLVVAGRGTSDNAARYAQYLLGLDVQLPVALATPWLYSGGRPPRLTRGAVLAISQSGRSPDIVAVIEAARAQRRPAIAITNDPGSPLALAADLVIGLLAGTEGSVAATKTYLASLHAIAQLSACMASGDIAAQRRGWLQRLPAIVSEAAAAQLESRERFDPLSEAALLTVVGRGLQLPTAHETALKVREVSGIPAEAFSTPDLMHGPVAALDGSAAVWVISTTGRGQPDLALLERLRQDRRVTVTVSDRDELLGGADIAVKVAPGLPAWLAPIVAVLPGQAAALRLGERRGVDVDHPHGLRKVTLTK